MQVFITICCTSTYIKTAVLGGLVNSKGRGVFLTQAVANNGFPGEIKLVKIIVCD